MSPFDAWTPKTPRELLVKTKECTHARWAAFETGVNKAKPTPVERAQGLLFEAASSVRTGDQGHADDLREQARDELQQAGLEVPGALSKLLDDGTPDATDDFGTL